MTTVRRRVAGIVVAAACGLGAGCPRPITQLVVQLESEIPEDELRELTLQCAYDWDGLTSRTDLGCERPLTRGASIGQVQLPGTFGVIAEASRRIDDPVTVAVMNASGSLRRVLRTRFAQGQTLTARVVLRRACAASVTAAMNTPCPASRATCTLSESCEARGQTCGNEGACRPVDLGPDDIGPADGGARGG